MTTQKTSYISMQWLARIAVFLSASAALSASSLFIGFNTLTPVQIYDTSGHYSQDFGPAGAIAAFPDGTGNYFAVTPTSTYSTVTEYNSNLVPTGSFTIGNVLTDGSAGPGGLLFSAYDGSVYRVSTSGTVLNSWNTGYAHVGVTSDGTNIFTTEGDGGNLIDEWSASGASLGHIATPFTGLYGLGYDAASGDFWAGTTNFVYELSGTGSLLATFDVMGDSRTPNGAVHDGLEVGDLVTPPPPPPPVTTTPEPSAGWLLMGGGAMLMLLRWRRGLQVTFSALVLSAACFGSVSVRLTPSLGSGAPVGSTITWTAAASDSTNSGAKFTYQFSVGPSGGPLQMVRDFYTFNTFPWTPSNEEGVYDVQVIARSSTGATGMAMQAYDVSSRVTGGTPVVSRTNHPLVALYSVPPCPSGHTARVRFKLPTDYSWQTTPSKTCNGRTSLNFYIAGMRGSNTYQLQQDVFNGPFSTPGPVLSFRTGAVPSLPIASYSIVKGYPAPNNTAYPVQLLSPSGAVGSPAQGAIPYATDTSGQIIWYIPVQSVAIEYMTRPMPGGTFFIITSDGTPGRHSSLLREYDLAGNVIRETNYAAISQQLVARGDDPINSFHHETIELPNGEIAFLASSERIANQGAGLKDVLGDQVIVVDSNLQVKWYWNEFDHLDVSRPAILGETCTINQAGCPPITKPGYT